VLRGEQRELRFALLTPAQFGAGPAPAADAIDAYYKAHQAQYMTTESVKLAYAELSLADVAAKVMVNEAQLRERYATTKDQYVEVERRRARHILVNDKAEADKLYADLSAGKDFAALAKANSKDPGSAAQGGDLGWADPKSYVPEFTAALLALKDGETSKPVKTQFGYHIIKLEGVQAGKTRSFDDLKGELEAQMKKDYAGDKFGEAQEQLQQRLDKGAGNFDELVKEFGLKAGTVETFEKGKGGAPLGADATLNELVFGDKGLNQHAVVGPVAQGEEHLVIAKVVEHRPAAPKPLAEVKDSIVAALVRQRGIEAAQKAADAALARLKAGEAFDKILGDLKVKSDPARFVARTTSDLPVQVRSAAFASARPEAGKPVLKVVGLDEGGVALLAVTAAKLPKPGEDAAGQAALSQAEIRRHGTVEADAYVDEIVRTAKVTKNLQVFQ
jgi:peptidyl-prolyl cis-trans isomerase D